MPPTVSPRLPPGPKGHWLTGNLAEFRADRLAFFARCAREYGDVVPLRLLGYRIILLSRPDLIEQVLVTQAKHFVKHFGLRMYKPILGNGLVTSEGDFWRRQRKLSAPAFQASRLAGYAAEMVAAAERTAAAWATSHAAPEAPARSPNPRVAAGPQVRSGATRDSSLETPSDGAAFNARGVVRDVHTDMMRLTLEIACRTLFGADACPDPDVVGQAMEEGLAAIGARFQRALPLPGWLPTPSNRRLGRSMRTLRAVVAGMIARRQGGAGAGEAGNDLLSILLAARDDADGTGMTDAQLLDEVLTLFLAGHETTALALSYALYLLAAHPDAQAALRDELSTVLGGRAPSYDDLPRLPFTRKVVTESMRLYPPADFLGREAIEDCAVAGIPVRRGTTLFVSQWAMHHDARYFPDPERFDPARWTDAFERSLPRFAYFPFGGGPRYCVGQTFATAEAALVLATLCRQFRFEPDPTFRLELDPGITLRPRAGVRVVVVRD